MITTDNDQQTEIAQIVKRMKLHTLYILLYWPIATKKKHHANTCFSTSNLAYRRTHARIKYRQRKKLILLNLFTMIMRLYL